MENSNRKEGRLPSQLAKIMKRIPNPELDRIILNTLSEKYGLSLKREGIHLSTLIYCLTRSFFDQKAPILPTDNEVMLFSTGYGLQEILTPKQAEVPIFEKGGIFYRPDFVFPVVSNLQEASLAYLVELKTTRSGVKRYTEGDLPETWVEYMMGGCYIIGAISYNLSVLYVSERPSPKIISERLVFEQDELQANWERILSRKAVYEKGLSDGRAPEPFKYCKIWECKSCRYAMMCNAIVPNHNKEESSASKD